MENKTFKIIFNDNTGSFAVDAIAATVQGTWRNSVSNYDGQGHDLAFVDVPAENAEYLAEMLRGDENVVEFSEQ